MLFLTLINTYENWKWAWSVPLWWLQMANHCSNGLNIQQIRKRKKTMTSRSNFIVTNQRHCVFVLLSSTNLIWSRQVHSFTDTVRGLNIIYELYDYAITMTVSKLCSSTELTVHMSLLSFFSQQGIMGSNTSVV